MEKNSKFLFLLGIVLTVFTVIVFAFFFERSQNLVEVVVANQVIEPRTEITEDLIRIEKIPASAKQQQAYASKKTIVGGYSTTKIFPGTQMIKPMVVSNEEKNANVFSALAGENLRAMPLALDGTIVTGGKVKQGDFIDIMASFKAESVLKTAYSHIILQQVEVFDVTKPDAEGHQTAFLVLRSEEAEMLSFCKENAQITILFNPANPVTSNTTGITPSVFMQKIGYGSGK